MDALLRARDSRIERVGVSYLQPAEVARAARRHGRDPEVMRVRLSFQHASAPLLRRMRASAARSFRLIDDVRRRSPLWASQQRLAVPGETEAEVDELAEFLTAARLDVVGVFGYSDEDGTEGELLSDKVPAEAIAERVERITDLIEELTAQRAEDRIGESVRVLVEEVDEVTGDAVGRAEHQGPDVDGTTRVVGLTAAPGETVRATVVGRGHRPGGGPT